MASVVLGDVTEAIHNYNDHHENCDTCSNGVNVTLRIKCPTGANLISEVVTAVKQAGMVTVGFDH